MLGRWRRQEAGGVHSSQGVPEERDSALTRANSIMAPPQARNKAGDDALRPRVSRQGVFVWAQRREIVPLQSGSNVPWRGPSNWLCSCASVAPAAPSRVPPEVGLSCLRRSTSTGAPYKRLRSEMCRLHNGLTDRMGDSVSLEGAAYDRKTHPDHHRRTRYCGQRRRRCFDCGLGRECGHLLRRTRDLLGSAPKSVVLAVESLASSVGVDMLDAASQLQVGHAPPSVLRALSRSL